MKKEKTANIGNIFPAFWKGIKPDKGMFFGAFLFFFLSQMPMIFAPLYYKKFFDLLGTSADRFSLDGSLISLIVIVLALHLANWLFWRLGMFYNILMQSRIMTRLKQNAFNSLLYHSHGFFADNFTGSLVQKVNRFSRSFETLCDIAAFNILPVIVTIIGSIIITWLVAPIISIVIAVWVVFFITFNFFFSRWKMQFNLAVSEADSKTTGYLADAITNSSAISFFTGHAYERIGFAGVSGDQEKKMRTSWLISDISDGVYAMLIILVEFFVFYFVIKHWEDGSATIGTFVLAQTYIIGLAGQLWGLVSVIRRISESIADAKEMTDILALQPEIRDVPAARALEIRRGEIAFEHIRFNFNETREVLSDIDLTIGPGEKVALIGPSGAGKTTLVRLIMRVYDPTSGAILIDGQDIHAVTQESLRDQISFVPQEPVLFHRTLMENIRYGRRDATDEEVIQAAKLAHCDEFIDHLPLGYQTFVGERGIKLSGGERQRVAIARAILKKAPILILDEATSSLDSHSEALIQNALDTLMKGCTTVVIAHRLSTIKKMDRIIAVQGGKIVEEGTHAELLKKSSGLYKKLWDLQVSGFIQK